MDDRDWTQNQSYHYTFSGEDAPETKPRKPRRSRGMLAAALVIIFVIGVGVCMASGMSLHFNRFDSGFSLSLKNTADPALLHSDLLRKRSL